MQELAEKIKHDLIKVGLTEHFNLVIRDYSKSYFGRYDPNTNTVILYVYKSPDKSCMFSYEELLNTAIHEVIHCKQWNDPKFKRLRGVMHDPEFKRLYCIYSNRARARCLFKEVLHGSLFTASIHKNPNLCGVYC